MDEPKDPGEYGREYGEEKFWDKARSSFQQAGERVLEPAVLAEACERAGLAAQVEPSPTEAVRRAVGQAQEEDMVVVTGSFRLIGPARAAVAAALS